MIFPLSGCIFDSDLTAEKFFEMKILTYNYSPYSQDIWEASPDMDFHAAFGDSNEHKLPLCPHYFFDSTHKKKHFFQHNNYPHLALELILSGKMEFKTADRREICGPGEMYVITPGTTVRFIRYSREPMRKIALLFSGARARLTVEAFGFWESMKLKLSDPEPIERQMRRIGEMIRTGQHPEARALEGFALLLKLVGEQPETDLPPGIRRAVQLMHKEIANLELNSEQLPQFAGYSLQEFRKKFYVACGVPPMKYLTEERMKLARSLLETTSLRIKEIIARIGFNSSHSFSLTFRRNCGCSPRQYRDRSMNPKPAGKKNL